MTLDQFLVDVLRNSPVLGATALFVWLSLPQLAERFAIVAKLMKPFSKKARQAAIDERDAKEQDRREKLAEEKRVRDELLAAAQATAQRTATEATTEALVVVTKQCKECREELGVHRDVLGKMIDVLEEILPGVEANHRTNARAIIRLARSIM